MPTDFSQLTTSQVAALNSDEIIALTTAEVQVIGRVGRRLGASGIDPVETAALMDRAEHRVGVGRAEQVEIVSHPDVTAKLRLTGEA